MARPKNGVIVAGQDTVTVGCRLPNGLIIDDPLNPNRMVILNGRNKATIIGAQYGVTLVDKEFWDMWISQNANFSAVKSGAIFAVGNIKDIAIAAKEVENERTGFEPMPQKVPGIEPAKESE